MQHRSVLVVDDDPKIRRSMASALRPHFVVTVATDGADALSKIGEGHEYDAVLCDYRMPNMDDRLARNERRVSAGSRCMPCRGARRVAGLGLQPAPPCPSSTRTRAALAVLVEHS
jgi:hypothetical protein